MAVKSSTKYAAKKPKTAAKKATRIVTPKKATKTPKPSPTSKSYRELVIESIQKIVKGKKSSGASRIAIKKQIKKLHPKVGQAPNFDLYVNAAIKKGQETGEFLLPKGPSGSVKLGKLPASKEGKVSTANKTKINARSASTLKSISTTGNGKLKRPEKKNSKSSKDGNKAQKTTGSEELTKNHTKKSNSRAKKEVTSTQKPAAKSSSRALTKSKSKTVSSKQPAKNTVTYRSMLLKSIIDLNEGKGSSPIALKKFILDKYRAKNPKILQKNFNYLINDAIKKGIEKGEVSQPNGPRGIVKILKKGKLAV